MVVPQRDLPGESDMVGLVADMRVLEVRTGGLSYLGTLMQVAHVVRERLWHPPPPMAMAEFPFVNFEWTDFESRHGFCQEPPVLRRAVCMSAVVRPLSKASAPLLTMMGDDAPQDWS